MKLTMDNQRETNMNKEKEYRTTKEECEEMINKDYVCERCGRGIVSIETVDNSGHPTFWSGCWHTDNHTKDDCGHFTSGVPKYIYKLAEKLVCEEGSYYSHTNKSDYKNTPKEREYWFQTEQSGWANLLIKIEHLKNNPSRKTKKEVLEDKYF
jgi:hypothetical protein